MPTIDSKTPGQTESELDSESTVPVRFSDSEPFVTLMDESNALGRKESLKKTHTKEISFQVAPETDTVISTDLFENKKTGIDSRPPEPALRPPRKPPVPADKPRKPISPEKVSNTKELYAAPLIQRKQKEQRTSLKPPERPTDAALDNSTPSNKSASQIGKPTYSTKKDSAPLGPKPSSFRSDFV